MKMLNKKAKQIEAKKAHREQLKQKRRSEKVITRSEPTRDIKPTILIVCEGENTEPSYFKQFKLTWAEVFPVGEGYNTTSLVGRAQVLSEKKKFDQVWCVFDKDSFQPQNFNSAIQNAEALGFGVAYSNQSFEYWLLLHFNDHQGGGMNRSDYDPKINELIQEFGVTYDGKTNKIVSEDFFELLDGIDNITKKERKVLAIERAKKIYNSLDHNSPALEESSTTVFRLVEELLKYR